MSDPFSARSTLSTSSGSLTYFNLQSLEAAGLGAMARLPFSIRVLLESALRNLDDFIVTQDDVRALAGWSADSASEVEIPFMPSRVVLQDFTGVPCVVDLAAMRAAMERLGGDPKKINPLVPCDLVIDHSVQVDHFGSAEALQKNVAREFERNKERYEFLKWGQKSLANFRAVPPDTGIVHQVNLEYLAGVALTKDVDGTTQVFPDSVVGTDSHTTMINGLGVLGWGVGGIEAEAVMLGQPVYMLMPEVVGFELSGALPEGATATDMVLRVVQMLRELGVVSKFVEFFGDGVQRMTLADRATIANMAPEYGATMGFFPVDAETIRYLTLTGRPTEQVELVESYYKAQGLFVDDETPTPEFSDTMRLDLTTVVPALAGPKRPQDRVALTDMKSEFASSLQKPIKERGFNLSDDDLAKNASVNAHSIGHGAVVIAAITSCTNTSNPSVMIAAGLVAKKAVARGLSVPSHVKTSLAPGSRVVTEYLEKAELDGALDTLGFQTVGYGCTTCIGNSGPLPSAVSAAIIEKELVACSVLSGNRNFEGRVNPHVKANYLASPPLVVGYAIAGRVDIDLTTEPLGVDSEGQDVFLSDIWPTNEEVHGIIEESVAPEMFREQYEKAVDGPQAWQDIPATASDLYAFDADSTYIQEPPFFLDMATTPSAIQSIEKARVLVMVGDSTTTDHISPAGAIQATGPAGDYLKANGVEVRDFNSYGSRRGNDRVMTRGTFANVRLRNQMAPGTEGGITRHLPSGEQMSIFDAGERYKETGTPLVVLAGKEYGTGSSRDWAAKGTLLLGVKMVIAENYERIHRSNLVGMGVLPLQYRAGDTAQSLGLTGEEEFSVSLDDSLTARSELTMTATHPETGATTEFQVVCRIDTPVEVDYYRNGGILHTVLRKLLAT
jgi:aconitate hydratase